MPRILTTILATTLLLGVALAQRTLTPHDVARLESISAVAVSPDGRFVAYKRSIPRDPLVENGTARSQLWVRTVESGESRPYVTDGPVGAFTWRGDSKAVLFSARRGSDKKTKVWSISVTGGEAQALFEPEGSIKTWAVCRATRRIAYTCSAPKKSDAAASAAKGFDQILFGEEEARVELRVADLEAGTDEVVPMEGAPWELAFSPDGKHVAAWVSPTPSIDDRYMARRLHVVDFEKKSCRKVADNPGKVGNFAWSPDGETIAFITGRDINDPKESSVAIVPATGGAMRILTPETFEGHAADVVWKSDSDLRFRVSMGCRTGFGKIKRDGSGAGEWFPEGDDAPQWTAWSMSTDGSVIALVGNARTHPGELFISTTSGGEPTRVTTSNPWLSDVKMAKQEVISYEARDGVRIEGVLIHPLESAAGAAAPLILQVHGGPESHYSNGWLTAYSMPGQVAAGRGYAVFHINYRSSTGRGVAFSKMGQGRSAREEFDDLVDGIDHLAAKGLIDPAKVGITGGSYGGYASAWGATYYSDRFAASVMFVGISEQISKIFTTDIPNESFYSHWRMRPWGNWQKYLEASPIYYVERAKTPILIAHGQDDPRVPVAQSIELYRALQIKGDVPCRLVLYPGEGHGNRKAAARLDYSMRQLRWFDHYLKGPGGDMPDGEIDYSEKSESK